jgi:lipopolysaccharide export system permease protein
VYKVASLTVNSGQADGVEIERKGREHDVTYPSWLVSALTARWHANRQWNLIDGTLHVLGDNRDFSVRFDSLRDRHFVETPTELMASPKAPQEMRYQELGRYVGALERSGSNVRTLRVERALKLAIPVTCIIIAIFGAPLATSNQRGGAAYGIGVSLGITIAFLIFIQLTKAIGEHSQFIAPEFAAWVPNVFFGIGGLLLLWRVRT